MADGLTPAKNNLSTNPQYGQSMKTLNCSEEMDLTEGNKDRLRYSTDSEANYDFTKYYNIMYPPINCPDSRMDQAGITNIDSFEGPQITSEQTFNIALECSPNSINCMRDTQANYSTTKCDKNNDGKIILKSNDVSSTNMNLRQTKPSDNEALTDMSSTSGQTQGFHTPTGLAREKMMPPSGEQRLSAEDYMEDAVIFQEVTTEVKSISTPPRPVHRLETTEIPRRTLRPLPEPLTKGKQIRSPKVCRCGIGCCSNNKCGCKSARTLCTSKCVKCEGRCTNRAPVNSNNRFEQKASGDTVKVTGAIPKTLAAAAPTEVPAEPEEPVINHQAEMRTARLRSQRKAQETASSA